MVLSDYQEIVKRIVKYLGVKIVKSYSTDVWERMWAKENDH